MGAAHVATLTTARGGRARRRRLGRGSARAPTRPRADGGARAIADPHELIADPGVDAVVVASFDTTHEEFVLACIAAGKPVLCEKPLATTADACLRVIEAEVRGRPAARAASASCAATTRLRDDQGELDDGGVGAVLLVALRAPQRGRRRRSTPRRC